jgi:nucleoside-diphosphate-sugar epimerase
MSRRNSGGKSQPNNFICDITEVNEVKHIIKECNPNIILHFAGNNERSNNIEKYYDVVNVNLGGAINVIDGASQLENLEKILFVGSGDEYGKNIPPFLEEMQELPSSAYSFSKTCVRQLCMLQNETKGVPTVFIRPSIAYGGGQEANMFIPSIIKSLLLGENFKMTPGNQTRDFIFIDDLVDAIMKIIIMEDKIILGQVYNIGAGVPVSIREVALLIGKIMGKEYLINIGAITYRENEVMNYYMSNKKFSTQFDWLPKVSITEGLNKTIKYYNEVANGI